ncbi:hypothetical protein HYW46_07360 [Candidatus Daviesbacteria bacterium]|nr:hypothetical protein [Candidatus Daviesbacteria bacterium]
MSPEAKRKFIPLDEEVFKLVVSKNSRRIGKTIPEIAPFFHSFHEAFTGNRLVLEAGAYSAKAEENENGEFWRLALILKLKSGLTKRQLRSLERLVPKEIPIDIPIVYKTIEE